MAGQVDGAGVDGVHGRSVRRRNVDAEVERDGAVRADPRVVEERADRVLAVERLQRPAVGRRGRPPAAERLGDVECAGAVGGEQGPRPAAAQAARCGCGRRGGADGLRTGRRRRRGRPRRSCGCACWWTWRHRPRTPKALPHGPAHGPLTASGGRPLANRVTTGACQPFEFSARSRSTRMTARRSPSAGAKQRAVLAVLLLLRAGEVVSTDFLINSLWGESAPKTAATSLQNSILGLRQLLGPNLLRTKPPGYVLARERRLVRPRPLRAPRRRRRGRSRRSARACLREALDLWRGAPLAEFAYEPFADPSCAGSRSCACSPREEWFDAELESGRDAELVPQLESLVAEHPLRERLVGQLMLALYRAGRQADALAAYQATCRRFVDELGLDPGPQLQELHVSILNQEVGLHPARRRVAARSTSRRSPRCCSAGSLVPVLGTGRQALAGAARAPVRLPGGRRAGPDACRAVRRADEGLRAALRRAARHARRALAADAGAPVLRVAAAAAARARGTASAARDDGVRPCARAGVPRRGRRVRRRLVRRVGPRPRPLLPSRGRTGPRA